MSYTFNPIDDAQDYFARLDKQPEPEPEYKCDNCGNGFDRREDGVKIVDEKFCKECYEGHHHFDYYRTAGLTDDEIYQAVEEVRYL